MFEFSIGPIEPHAWELRCRDAAAGALVAFCGLVRNHSEGREILGLEYEACEALAVREGSRIVAEAEAQFGIHRAVCVHRVGKLAIGDTAVWVGVSSAHRQQAFAACRYIIDQVKARVPIWKKEHFASGQAYWVNCGPAGPPPGNPAG